MSGDPLFYCEKLCAALADEIIGTLVPVGNYCFTICIGAEIL